LTKKTLRNKLASNPLGRVVMFKTKNFNLLILSFLAVSFLIFLSFGLAQEKAQGKGKPPGKDKKTDPCALDETLPLLLENAQVVTSTNYIYQLKHHPFPIY